MLYLVHMTVRLPADLDPAMADRLKQEEKHRCLDLQRSGTWRHIWRVTGQYANYSVFDVASHDELHRLLTGLPLFPYMDVDVVALSTHPSALEAHPDAAH